MREQIKEITKLNKQEKIQVGVDFVMAILSIIVAIVENDFTWGIVAMLWFELGMSEYFNKKILKAKDKIIEMQEEALFSAHEGLLKIKEKIQEEK